MGAVTETDSDSDSEVDEVSSEETVAPVDKLEGVHLPRTLDEAASLLGVRPQSAELSPLAQLQQKQGFDDSDSSEDEELEQHREEIKRLQQDYEAQVLASQVAAKAARSADWKHRREQEKCELAHQKQVLAERQASLLASSGTAPSTEVRKDLKEKVAEHKAKTARKAASKKSKQQPIPGDITMGGIRALPGVRGEVDQYIRKLKSAAPTLASDPTAVGFMATPAFQPDKAYVRGTSDSNSPTNKHNLVYVAELGQVIPMVSKLSDLPGNTDKSVGASRPVPVIDDPSDSESECSADENCHLEQNLTKTKKGLPNKSYT